MASSPSSPSNIAILRLEQSLCGIGTALNVFVLFLIYKKSSKELANYKYFLFSFVSCDVLYSVFHVVVEPVVAVRGGALLIYGRGWLRDRVSISVYSCVVSQCLVLISYHFIYRALVVTQNLWYFAIHPRKVAFFLVLICSAFFSLWFWVVFAFFRMREGQFGEIAAFAAENAEEFPKNYSYELVMIVGKNSVTGAVDLTTIAGVCVMLAACSLSIGAIILSTIAITVTLRRHTFSPSTLSQQRRLFIALLVQFSVPMACIYCPFSLLIILPFFPHSGMSIPVWVGGLFYSFYPIGDSLAILLLIADYRRACVALGWWLVRLLGVRREDPARPSSPAISITVL